jgi:hypothetical protein
MEINAIVAINHLAEKIRILHWTVDKFYNRINSNFLDQTELMVKYAHVMNEHTRHFIDNKSYYLGHRIQNDLI